MAPLNQRFHSLDALRGIAALSVVFWHWQHFFFVGGSLGPMDSNRLPFHRFTLVFYERGWLAVQLFFTISGFIFFWLYRDTIRSRELAPRRFALLRFSRLWPLYLITLLIVALLQIAFFRRTSTFFVYPFNTPLQFIQHLLFLSGWTDRGFHSFNGPAWSISVEVVLYFLFFLFCRFLPVRALSMVAIVVVGQVLFERTHFEVARGIEPFFLGGLMFQAYETIVRKDSVVAWTWCIAFITVGVWALGLTLMFSAITPQSLAHTPVLRRFENRLEMVFSDWPRLVLFPLLVLTLALVERLRGSLGKPIAFLGDLSYSIYLLHFPLQLIAIYTVFELGFDREVFYLPSTLIAFFIVLIAISFLSYRYFEMPAQSYLRSGVRRVVAQPG